MVRVAGRALRVVVARTRVAGDVAAQIAAGHIGARIGGRSRIRLRAGELFPLSVLPG
ncbi:hypothetical protein GBP346_A1777 [Burkholderia pseudomallei MSHR346]|nr:hypothetical protein GBP346_A1777 [Burkholderia pseudomallei MSHR346]